MRSSGVRRGVEQLFGDETARANERQDRIGVRAVARVDDDVEADTAKRRVWTQAVDADMEDVDALRREQTGELVQRAGSILEPRAEREVASRRDEALLQHLPQQVRVDVAAAHDRRDARAADVAVALEDRGDRRGTRALRDELLPLDEQDDRARDG